MFDKKKYPYTYSGYCYAVDIVDGKIVACTYIKKACERYLKDLKRIKEDKDCPFYFRPEKSEKYLRLVQRFTHVIGKWETNYIKYEPWQNFTFSNIMGFYSHYSKERRFRTAYVEIARGCGKSLLASQMALYFLALESVAGNQIACIATRRDQARIVLDSARAMAKANKSYLKHTGVKVLAHQITHEKSNSHLRALSSDSSGLDGQNLCLAVCDELHAMQRKTFEVIESGMSKRNDSLMLCITTAGYNVEGVGHAQSSYAKKVALGEVEDDTFFSLVYTIDRDDDPLDPSIWLKANPNMGVSVDPVNFEAKAKKAKENASDYNNFKIKHLNVWTSETLQFFDTNALDRCIDTTLDIEDFRGEPCYIGVDLASKIDLTSIYYIFKRGRTYYGFGKSYLPEARLVDTRNVKYSQWAKEGHLILLPGEVIDYDVLIKQLIEDSKKYIVRAVHLDPWQAQSILLSLAKERVEALEYRMVTSNLSAPTKELDAIIREGRFRFNGSGVFRWCIGNVVARLDAAQNVFPKKEHDRLKIDEAIAAIMSLGGWINEDQEESVYEERGLLVF